MRILIIDKQNKFDFDFEIDLDNYSEIEKLKNELANQKTSIIILRSEDLSHYSRKKELHKINLDDFSPHFKTYFNFSVIVVFKAYKESKILKNRYTDFAARNIFKNLNLDLGKLHFTCNINCDPSDMVEGGKCDLNGCYSKT